VGDLHPRAGADLHPAGLRKVAPADAATRAYGLIEQAVTQLATLLGHIDLFGGYALLAAVPMPVAFFLRRPAEGRGAGGGALRASCLVKGVSPCNWTRRKPSTARARRGH
jgi:hypothetical protein